MLGGGQGAGTTAVSTGGSGGGHTNKRTTLIDSTYAIVIGANGNGGNAGANSPTGLTLGAYYSAVITGLWDGDIAEILIYDPNLSTADMNEVANYLSTKLTIGYTDI